MNNPSSFENAKEKHQEYTAAKSDTDTLNDIDKDFVSLCFAVADNRFVDGSTRCCLGSHVLKLKCETGIDPETNAKSFKNGCCRGCKSIFGLSQCRSSNRSWFVEDKRFQMLCATILRISKILKKIHQSLAFWRSLTITSSRISYNKTKFLRIASSVRTPQ